MREIKFRGRNFAGRWFYGSLYVNDKGDTLIDRSHWEREEVEPESVGQLIGLTDKNGVEIFEGDIVEIQQPTSVERGAISFLEGAFAFTSQVQVDGNRTIVYLHSVRFQNNWKLEVIGNIYENPELLEVSPPPTRTKEKA